MIRDLVDAAPLGVGAGGAGDLQTLDLRAFVLDLQERLAGTLDTERIQVQAPEDLPPVLADADRLERILGNLLTNALKYSGRDAPVTVSLAAEGGEVVTAVADEGRGIPSRGSDPHPSERYFRSESARAGRQSGLGLGRYIARNLVLAHGGRIWAESEVDRGSTVLLRPAAAYASDE